MFLREKIHIKFKNQIVQMIHVNQFDLLFMKIPISNALFFVKENYKKKNENKFIQVIFLEVNKNVAVTHFHKNYLFSPTATYE